MVNDPIGDMLAQIKNASMAGKKTVNLPLSRVKKNVAEILKQEGYLTGVGVEGDKPKERLILGIRYEENSPVITDVKRKSKPGLRIYVGTGDIKSVVGGMGISIVSTPQGIMTGKNARKLGIGGELLCEIW